MSRLWTRVGRSLSAWVIGAALVAPQSGCDDDDGPDPDRTVGGLDSATGLPTGAQPRDADGRCPAGSEPYSNSADSFCVPETPVGLPPDAAVDPEPDAELDENGCPPSDIEEGWMTCEGRDGELVREDDCRWYFYFEGREGWSSGTERGVYGNCQELLNE